MERKMASCDIPPETNILSIESLKQETGVTDDQLKNTLSEKDQYMLAKYFNSLDKFNLSPAEYADIQKVQNEDGHQLAMFKALKLWHQKDPTMATFGALIQIALDLRDDDLSMVICNYLANIKVRETPHITVQNGQEFESIAYQTALRRMRIQQNRKTSDNPLIVEHKSYHHDVITGVEAESRLQRQCKTRCYLARFSQRQGYYILTVCDPVPHGETVEYKMKHFVINFKECGVNKEYWIHDKKVFPGFNELLQFYENHRIHPGLPDIGKCLVHNNVQLSDGNGRLRNSFTIALSSANRIDLTQDEEICCNCTCQFL